jgi:putative methylase
MRKKELEILLQKVPPIGIPNPSLEQYLTPSPIAADVLFLAYQFGDIKDKFVIELGCGTGIFSIGAITLGAKKVTGIDIDKRCIDDAISYAKKSNLQIEFIVKDIDGVQLKGDTILMNPPFGAQKSNKNADRKFIEKGFEISQIIYSLHLTKTIPFLEKMISSLNGEITYSKEYDFPIKHMFEFHDKIVLNYKVTLLRIKTK